MAFWNVNVTLKIEYSEEKVLFLDGSEIPNHWSEFYDIFLRIHGSKKQWGTSTYYHHIQWPTGSDTSLPTMLGFANFEAQFPEVFITYF